MTECHKCDVAVDIEAGKYRRTKWKNTPCATCSSRMPANHRGRSHINLDDALEWTPDPGAAKILGFSGDPQEEHSTKGDAVVAAMSYLAKQILAQPPRTREIILDRLAYPTRSLRIVAERLGISIAAAHDRLKVARKSWPALAYAIPMKSWRWKRGADVPTPE